MGKSLQFSVFQFSDGTRFHQLLLGDHEVFRSRDQFPDLQPSAMINVRYDDFSAYSHSDLMAAIEQATVSEDFLFAQMYDRRLKLPKAVGHLALFPLKHWRGRELEIFEFLKPQIERAIATVTMV